MPAPAKRFSLKSYDLRCFDENFCLKPPVMLWLAILYLARAILIPFISGVSSMGGGARDASSLTHGLFGPEDLVPATLTLTVVLAFFRRVPSASGVWRRLWSLGRIVLSVAALCDLALSLYRFFAAADAYSSQPVLLLLQSTLDVYVLIYLIRSRRIRDVFSDFPAPG